MLGSDPDVGFFVKIIPGRLHKTMDSEKVEARICRMLPSQDTLSLSYILLRPSRVPARSLMTRHKDPVYGFFPCRSSLRLLSLLNWPDANQEREEHQDDVE